MIHIVRQPATSEQIAEMAQIFGGLFVKLAVDVRRDILAGGGELHADCEQVLLEDGSQQEDIWGADWYPHTGEVGFEALLNIRPRQRNYCMEIRDPDLRSPIESILRRLMEGEER
ncbi:MAG: hypothetical protein DRI48_04490 [Chloroflexi bacterium]|nr:MAG: hypothetical protein DRI48_04490 [Chloroflexota bacterium]